MRRTVANDLTAGQYVAPVFEYIFPENVKPGDLVVPNDLWHLPFLRSGEGATTQSDVGPSVGSAHAHPLVVERAGGCSTRGRGHDVSGPALIRVDDLKEGRG